MTAPVTARAIDSYLAGLAWLDAYDALDDVSLSLLQHTHDVGELLAGITAVASMLRKAVASEAVCNLHDVTGQLRDDILHTAARDA